MNQSTVWILDGDGWHPVVQTDRVMANRIVHRYRQIGVECFLEETPAVVVHPETPFEEPCPPQ